MYANILIYMLANNSWQEFSHLNDWNWPKYILSIVKLGNISMHRMVKGFKSSNFHITNNPCFAITKCYRTMANSFAFPLLLPTAISLSLLSGYYKWISTSSVHKVYIIHAITQWEQPRCDNWFHHLIFHNTVIMYLAKSSLFIFYSLLPLWLLDVSGLE